MRANSLVIFHPSSNEEISALKAFGKLCKMNFEVKTEKRVFNKEEKEILNGIKKGFKEVQLIEKGKLKAKPINDFLNEL